MPQLWHGCGTVGSAKCGTAVSRTQIAYASLRPREVEVVVGVVVGVEVEKTASFESSPFFSNSSVGYCPISILFGILRRL